MLVRVKTLAIITLIQFDYFCIENQSLNQFNEQKNTEVNTIFFDFDNAFTFPKTLHVCCNLQKRIE